MLFQLDFASDVPIYQQIRNQIVLGIAQGELKAGEKLPTVRALAQESGVNAMTGEGKGAETGQGNGREDEAVPGGAEAGGT